ncbi:MAG: hypothetical protein HZA08_12335 [Nitrospirae bacterium]|nr:hypothetical protein [Nitrospirota bacterium]
MEEQKFLWYEIVSNDEPVLQGDMLFSCPIFIPSSGYYPSVKEEITVPVEVKEYDVIVMSQSCDLVQGKIDLVLVCPIWPLNEFEIRDDFFKGRKGKEALRQGNVPGYHLLNRCEINEMERDFMVVDFRSVYSIPFLLINEIKDTQQKRLRLLPPYREHLSQAFARFFMRVGLPVDIPSFK